MADPLANLVRRGTAAVTTAWMPDRWWGWGCGIAGGYYSTELAVAYTPYLIHKLLLSLEKFFDAERMAPLLQKKMVTVVVPVSASIAAFAGFYMAVVITNLMVRAFAAMKKSNPA